MQLSSLKSSKNLLAFSGGVDSSALFFMLLDAGVEFDIALVNYKTREQSDKEEASAIALAQEHSMRCFTTQAPIFESHFEAKAREFRYRFFEDIIDAEGYDNLLTAHQLNDQLEWFLMRLSKGAGVSELIGLDATSRRVTPAGSKYQLIRPILDQTKDQLLEYLNSNNHPYFIDSSNNDIKFERNRFRREFADPLIKEFASGIKNSFAYLREDVAILQSGIKPIFSRGELRIFGLESDRLKAKAADIALKELGYLLSANQRTQIEQESSIVIGGKWAVEYDGGRLYVAPFVTTPMPKSFKELCRVSSIPAKIRAYCFIEDIEPKEIMQLGSL